MSKIIKFEATINELVVFQLDHSERMELIGYILHDLCSDNQFDIFLKTLLKNMVETEIDFDNNQEKINAYNNVIKLIK